MTQTHPSLKNCLKNDIFCSTQLDSAQLSSTQLDSAQLSSTQFDSVVGVKREMNEACTTIWIEKPAASHLQSE